ncbi:MAG: tetratricopeptide repeat protein, partial [Nitrospirota bacterium]
IGGCGRVIPPPPTAPSLPIARPPTSDSRSTDQLIKGIRTYQDGRYTDASKLFSQLITSKPSAPLLMEARWHLAKSYAAAGKKDLASEELARFLDIYPNSPYEDEARSMLNRQEPPVSTGKVIALIWAAETAQKLTGLLPKFSDVVVDTVILEVSNRQLIKSAQTASQSIANDPLSTWINEAKNAGLRVFLSVPLRIPVHTPSHRSDDLDQKSRSKGLFETRREELDLFDPQVRKEVLLFYRNIARYPLDGVYLNKIAYAPEEGRTPYAIASYQDFFSETLDVERLLGKKEDARATKPRLASSKKWRFKGLKSRYLADLLRQIHVNVNSVNSRIEFGIEIPEVLLIDPQQGLLETALDYMELRDSVFDFHVIATSGANRRRVLESLSKYGGGDRVWFSRAQGETFASLMLLPIQGVMMSGISK